MQSEEASTAEAELAVAAAKRAALVRRAAAAAMAQHLEQVANWAAQAEEAADARGEGPPPLSAEARGEGPRPLSAEEARPATSKLPDGTRRRPEKKIKVWKDEEARRAGKPLTKEELDDYATIMTESKVVVELVIGRTPGSTRS